MDILVTDVLNWKLTRSMYVVIVVIFVFPFFSQRFPSLSMLFMAAVEDAHDASQPLITDELNHSPTAVPAVGSKWRSIHTFTTLWLRTIVGFVYYCPMVFWLNYEADQGVTTWEYALVLISGEIGCVMAVFMADFIRNCLQSDENVMTIYLPICAAASVAYPSLAYFGQDQYVIANVIWCCVMRFFIGQSFAFISAASLKFASDHVADASQITGVVAVLYFSWPSSIALNIFAGYLITDDMWMMVNTLSLFLSLSPCLSLCCLWLL